MGRTAVARRTGLAARVAAVDLAAHEARARTILRDVQQTHLGPGGVHDGFARTGR